MGGDKNERLGYPTQKPVALLERLIAASSNEGDVILDPLLRLRDDNSGRPETETPLDRDRHNASRDQPHQDALARHLR